jgi:hypothetical protein
MDVLNSGNLIVISAAKSSCGVVYFDSALHMKIRLPGCDKLSSSRSVLTIKRKLLPLSRTLTIEAAGSSAMYAHLYHIAWCHNPENSHLHSHCCEHLKSHTVLDLTVMKLQDVRFPQWCS